MNATADLPPGAKFVLHVLHHHEPATASELQDRTDLSKRTVHRALDALRSKDLVHSHPDPTDARQTIYKSQKVSE